MCNQLVRTYSLSSFTFAVNSRQPFASSPPIKKTNSFLAGDRHDSPIPLSFPILLQLQTLPLVLQEKLSMVNHQVQSIFILDQVLVYHRRHHNALSLVKVQQEDLDTLYRMDGILMAMVTVVSSYTAVYKCLHSVCTCMSSKFVSVHIPHNTIACGTCTRPLIFCVFCTLFSFFRRRGRSTSRFRSLHFQVWWLFLGKMFAMSDTVRVAYSAFVNRGQ